MTSGGRGHQHHQGDSLLEQRDPSQSPNLWLRPSGLCIGTYWELICLKCLTEPWPPNQAIISLHFPVISQSIINKLQRFVVNYSKDTHKVSSQSIVCYHLTCYICSISLWNKGSFPSCGIAEGFSKADDAIALFFQPFANCSSASLIWPRPLCFQYFFFQSHSSIKKLHLAVQVFLCLAN